MLSRALDFFRCFGVDGEGVYARAKFVGKDFVHAALARNAVHAGKGARNDAHPKMRFALRSRSRMSGMSSAFVDDVESNRRQGFGELSSNLIRYAHRRSIARATRMSSVTFSCFFIFAAHNPRMGAAGYRPRFGKDIRIKPDAPAPAPAAKPCAKSGCGGEGTFRVPRSRERLDQHIWFCLQHAREHNETWDYFQGMSQPEIEAFVVDALTGHRPTWPLGKRAAHAHRKQEPRSFRDAHRVFGDSFEEETRNGANARAARPLTGPQARALDVLNLEAGASLHQIKARYKELVKRFHPDANGGDRGSEERLKRVIQAYGVLRASGLT